MKASVRDLRLRAGELLAAVERGDTVEVTYRGRPCARLVGVAESSDHSSEVQEGGDVTRAYAAQADSAADSTTADRVLDVHANPAFGMWADRTEQSVDALIDKVRAPRDFGGAS